MLLGSVDSPAVSLQEIREARVTAARRNSAWKELAQERLERRPFGVYVDTETGTEYRVHRGQVFHDGRVAFAERLPMAFFIDDGSNVVMLERRRS
jgi:hypothetical protein